MNWDQQLIKACTETDGTPHPHADHVLSGAKWMRDQLRTNESTERMAAIIYELEDPQSETGWENEAELLKNNYRSWAKTQITALLGDN